MRRHGELFTARFSHRHSVLVVSLRQMQFFAYRELLPGDLNFSLHGTFMLATHGLNMQEDGE
jgi:hypothetical protein